MNRKVMGNRWLGHEDTKSTKESRDDEKKHRMLRVVSNGTAKGTRMDMHERKSIRPVPPRSCVSPAFSPGPSDFWDFRLPAFVRISGFGFRASDFGFPRPPFPDRTPHHRSRQLPSSRSLLLRKSLTLSHPVGYTGFKRTQGRDCRVRGGRLGRPDCGPSFSLSSPFGLIIILTLIPLHPVGFLW